MHLLVTGLSLKDIAAIATISERTLRAHMDEIYGRVELFSGPQHLSVRHVIERLVYSEPLILAGCPVSPVVHPVACTCGSPFCAIQLIRDVRLVLP